ncbi:MAG: GIY-YIG nuclease family protein [Terracidiphilus sp.]
MAKSGLVMLSAAESKHLRLLLSLREDRQPCTKLAMPEGAYSTYIVASRIHTLYLGLTGNLQRRMFEHKWKEHDGFTERYNCDRLVWFETHQDIQDAIAREKQLKGWRREKKIALIEKSNPAWLDLSRDWYDVEPADLKRATDRMLS